MNKPGHQMPLGAAHGNALSMPQARYILPSFVERTSYGVKESNPYNKLFEERIIFLGVQIDDASANDVMAQLLTLESTDPDREIIMPPATGSPGQRASGGPSGSPGSPRSRCARHRWG